MIALEDWQALALAAWLVSRFNSETTAGDIYMALLDSGRLAEPTA